MKLFLKHETTIMRNNIIMIGFYNQLVMILYKIRFTNMIIYVFWGFAKLFLIPTKWPYSTELVNIVGKVKKVFMCGGQEPVRKMIKNTRPKKKSTCLGPLEDAREHWLSILSPSTMAYQVHRSKLSVSVSFSISHLHVRLFDKYHRAAANIKEMTSCRCCITQQRRK